MLMWRLKTMQPTLFNDAPDVPRLTGTHLVPVSGALSYLPLVRTGDVLRLNLDVARVADGGLYLCEFTDTKGQPWRGVRRFRKDEAGQLAYDCSGRADWLQLSEYEASRMTVIGHVEQVYKPAH